MDLIDSLIKEGWLRTPRIIDAFRKIKRVDFLTEELKDLSELNEALPIGFGQTISQPLVLAFMLEELQPDTGNKIIDIGSGSGWTTALLAEIVGPKGKVISMELVPELREFGEKNVSKYSFISKGIVEFICGDGSKGYEKEAPFDRVLVSAAANRMFDSWKQQLRIGGRIVAPINSSIVTLKKRQEADGKIIFDEKDHSGFVFVPLITK